MNSEEQDDLWCLLGKARKPTVSPFFSRDVIREVRNLSQEQVGFIAWLRRHWQVPALATCAVVVITGTFIKSAHSERLAMNHEEQFLAMAETVSESPDYQVIAHLDELLDSEESSLWLDGNTY
jgi:hypothetical protein